MNSEKFKKDKLREKAEEILQNQFNPKKDQSESDDYIHELLVNQIELEIQNKELQATQIRLEDSRHKYFDLYNFAPLGYFTLDKKGIILDVNLTGALLLEVERLKLQKRAFIQYIDPDFRKKFHNHIINVRETGNKQTVELKLLKKDNTSFYTHIETININNENGNFKEFRMTVSDISELKKTENALKEIKHNLELKVEDRTEDLKSANRYNRSLIEASIDPLVTIGSDGKITDVNHSTEVVTGFNRYELIDTDFSDYFTEPEKAREGYQKVFNEGFVLDYPLEIKNKNGNITPVLYNATVYKDEFGDVIGVFAAARDITEIRKYEQNLKEYQDTLEQKVDERTKELAKSNAELEHFAYVASHDLREPLRMITNFLQLLERRYNEKLDNDANDFIGFAVDGAKRLDDMINDLLEYSRVTRHEKIFSEINIESVLDNALMNLKVQIDENNALITHDPLPIIYGDEQLMVQLLQNLISNAIKYRSQAQPNIHISAVKEKNQYVFSVKDNGIGMKPKHLERIFTIFQRLHRVDEYDGTGIGLAIAQKIVHQHGGEIWAESELEKGSTFYFTILITT
jgi:two-component system, chemotaxis family, sensor kinase Cph1